MKFLRHLAGYLPVNLATAFTSFGGVYVFTRLLSGEDYGRYALMFSVMTLIHTASLTWVEASTYRFAGRAAEAGALPAHHRRAARLLLGSILAAWLIAGLVWLAVRDLPGYAAVMPWLAALLPFNAVVRTALESHRAGQRVARYAAVSVFKTLAGFAIGALLAWRTGLGAAAPFAGLLGAAALVAASEGIWLARASSGARGDEPADPPRAWLAYGLPVAAALALDLVLSASDRFLIALFLGERAVGAYAAGYGVADKTVLFICAWAAMAASPLVMSAYERGGPGAARQEARALARTILLVAAPAAAGLALVARPLSEAMIGETLRAQAADVIPWIAFAGLFNGLLIHYFSEAFQLARKTGLRAGLMAAPAALNVALNLALLPMLGLMGAVYATLASYVFGAALLGAVGRRFVAMPVPIGDMVRVAAACLAMWPAVAAMPALGGWAELFLKAGAGGAAYAAVAFALDAGGARAFVADRSGTSEPTPSA